MKTIEKLPIKITPCPILEAVIEIRFDTDVIPDAVFGIVYNSIKDDFEKPEGLPILQLPEVVRLSDPKFLYSAHYRLISKNYIFQIGPKVISLIVNTYNGWELFSNKIFELLDKISKLRIIKNISRLGLRYTNFFEQNIIDKLNFQINLQNETLTENIVFRTELKDKDDEFTSVLQISNNASLNKNNKNIIGSIIDIDTFTNNNKILDNFLSGMENLNKAHDIEKKLFFSLLKKEFLDTLNPEY